MVSAAGPDTARRALPRQCHPDDDCRGREYGGGEEKADFWGATNSRCPGWARRNDLVVGASEGDHAKPCLALVIQADLFDERPPVIVLPLVSS